MSKQLSEASVRFSVRETPLKSITGSDLEAVVASENYGENELRVL
jgi:hypothetical protein